MGKNIDVIIIGAGLTGLTTAYYLKKRGKEVRVIERESRAGGSVMTHHLDGYTFDSGPNTGSLSRPEIVELFEDLSGSCTLQIAREEAHKRLILKDGRLCSLPSGIISGFFTSLFTWKDKFRILLEPFRERGTNPDESVAELTIRRLGKSFLNYAVDPFISGVYAGDPFSLATRYAIPKLYNLEQTYGSFIRGAIKKAKEPKNPRDKKATRQVFSVEGGLENLIQALTQAIGNENILLGCEDIRVVPDADRWTVKSSGPQIGAPAVISTIGAYSLPSVFTFAPEQLIRRINNLNYAKIIQVSIGMSKVPGIDFNAFGALIPALEKRNILGVLYPSVCFDGRCPAGKVVLSVFLGGIKNPDLISLSDDEVTGLILKELKELYRLQDLKPDYIKIFRHYHAIPQYEKNTGERLQAIGEFQNLYPGIIIAGNLRDGIGMADRVKQAVEVANSII